MSGRQTPPLRRRGRRRPRTIRRFEQMLLGTTGLGRLQPDCSGQPMHPPPERHALDSDLDEKRPWWRDHQLRAAWDIAQMKKKERG